jgi:hypothetical protein
MRASLKAEDRSAKADSTTPAAADRNFSATEEQWLPHHQMEAPTRENYTYYLGKHILPVFGTMRLVESCPSTCANGHREPPPGSVESRLSRLGWLSLV